MVVLSNTNTCDLCGVAGCGFCGFVVFNDGALPFSHFQFYTSTKSKITLTSILAGMMRMTSRVCPAVRAKNPKICGCHHCHHCHHS